MMMRKLMTGLALTLAVSVTGCNCCKPGCSTCNAPLVAARPIAPPCNSCGPAPAPVLVPAPPGAVAPAPVVVPGGAGPYGASYERKT
jgi:hypothetical protein